MTRLTWLIPAIALVLTGGVSAVELKPTPIQSALQTRLAAGTGSQFYAGGEDWDESDGLQWGEDDDQRKSVGKAALYSMLLPGWGEYYVGHKRKARVFFAIEALSWIGFAGFTIYGNWKENDYIRFAAERAGADLHGKDQWFRDIVGFYDDIDQYNSFGRVYDPDRPYLDDNRANHWRWQNQSDRAVYRHLKNRSHEAGRRAEFMIGLAILNRVASVIDAVRDARRTRRAFDDTFGAAGGSSWHLEVNPLAGRRQVNLTFATPF